MHRQAATQACHYTRWQHGHSLCCILCGDSPCCILYSDSPCCMRLQVLPKKRIKEATWFGAYESGNVRAAG